MNQNLTVNAFVKKALMMLFCLGLYCATNAQSATSDINSATGTNWKDKSVMLQIIQAEQAQTNNDLAQSGLTDWSQAMLEAYKSLLTYTETGLAGAQDIQEVLDHAYEQMKNEPVAQPAYRVMVLDDMKAKQVELALKLSFN